MKPYKVFLLTLVTGLFISSLCHAQSRRTVQRRTAPSNYLYSSGYKNEVGASTSYSEINSANGMTYFQLSATYKYLIARAMQVGGILEAAIVSGNGRSETLTGIIGTFTYNINNSWNISNSLFVEAGLGISNARMADSAARSEQVVTYLANFGKHFPLFDKIQYTPKVGFRKTGSLDMAIIIVPLNLTFSF